MFDLDFSGGSVKGHLAAAFAHAIQINKLEQFMMRLKYLDDYALQASEAPTYNRVRLFKDFAPFSFSFVIDREQEDGSTKTTLQGGLIYHGDHDKFGSGAAPTFAVTLNPEDGWSIHT